MPPLSKTQRPVSIAITGSMGSGKSQVGKILKASFPVADCDAINAKLLQPGQAGYTALLEAGLIHLLPDGSLDKEALARDLFSSPDIKKQVEAILHPLIFARIDAWIAAQTSPLVFVEVPLLYETGAQDHFDAAWCIICEPAIALQRLLTGRQIDEKTASARLAHQMPPAQKAALADYVIDNSGSLEELEEAIRKGVKMFAFQSH